MQEPQDEPEPAAREEDIEVSRARILLKITELNQEARRLTAELEALPRQATPRQAQNPSEANQEEMSRAQGSPSQRGNQKLVSEDPGPRGDAKK